MEVDLAMYEEKVSKLEESRLALRKAVKIQDRVIDSLREENLRLIGGTEVMLEKERITAESECKKAEAEKKEAVKAWKIVEAEKSRDNEERRPAGIERKKSEEIGVQSENVLVQIQRKCIGADSEMREAEEQRVIAEANTKKAMEQKFHDDQLAQQLEDIRHKIEGLQNEISEFASSRKLVEAPVDTPDIRWNSETGKMKLLEEQLKFKKKQLKHAKKVAKLEIDRNKILQLELHLLKKECVQFSCLLDIVNTCFPYCSEGIDDNAKERGAFSDTVSAIAAVEKSNTSKRCIDAVGRKAEHSKKRKRVKSIDHLYPKVKNWQLRIEEMLDGMLNTLTGKSLEKNPCMMSNLECNPIALLDRAHKKRKESCGEVPLKHLCDLNGLHKDIRREVQAFDAVMGDSGRGNLGSHEEMEGNYMKPLDLHNAVGEDRYQKAIQVPLSPTLPVIEVHNTRGLVDENSFKASFSKQANQGPTCKIDDLNTDTESDRWKFGTSKTSHVPASNKNGGIANPFENVTNNGNN